jgi:hypothetical protein
MLLRLAPSLLVCLSVLPVARAQSPEFVQEHATMRTALVGRLLELATWCAKSELYGERDSLYRRVLAIDAENYEARKGLRYAHNPDGSWKEPAPRPAVNLNKKALEELPARRDEVLHPYRDALLALLAKEKDAATLAPAVHAELLQLDPDDPRVHALVGEVLDGGQWMLAETVTGKKRRADIRALVKSNLEGKIDASALQPEAAEAPLADAWSCGTATELVRVLGANGSSDCDAVARLLHASARVFGGVFGIEVKRPASFTFFLMPGPARGPFLDRVTDLSPELKALLAKAPGGGLPNGHGTALFEVDPGRRNDCAVRNALGELFRSNFDIQLEHGWAWEGLGLYLTRELVGTRFTWYVLANPSTESLHKSLLKPDSNWMNEGLKILTAANAPDLATVLAKPVSELAIPDMLVGYVFGAYLVEGRPEQAAEFLRRIGAGAAVEDVSRSVLGLSLRDLREHLLRWLKERK